MKNNLLEGLNDKQREAVLHEDGPLLLLAGAGSGKTRVLTHRIAYLIGERGVSPYKILALTFTNKAAGEMRERVDNLVSYGAESIWVSTFHSTCVRILRRYIDRLGYERSFSIYDADDQRVLMRDIIRDKNLDPKKYKERSFLNVISHAKDELISAEDFAADVSGDYGKRIQSDLYTEYQSRLVKNNALDFDDLIFLTVRLFIEEPDVLDYYQERFRYILVDEYQDTNTAQFKLLELLASRYKNLCVVGDDDQSIYKFRGANIYNILNFEKAFPETKVIRLEQNYRSTKKILAAASGVIKNNSMRKDKTLWTDAEEGEPIIYAKFESDYDEAEGVVDDIAKRVRESGSKYNDFAILYRANAQSRLFEEKLVLAGIPYRIIGAVNFYARKEIKDLICYLKTIDNGNDDVAVKRIINIPRRGIGNTSIDRISAYAADNGMSFYDALTHADYINGLGRSLPGINSFVSMIEDYRQRLRVSAMPDRDEYTSLEDLMETVIDETGYRSELEEEGTPESEARLENIESLINKIAQYEEETETPPLSGLLENIALVADIDTVDTDADQVLLMTMHGAKGLEFPYVYIVGMEENVFPSSMSMFDDEEIEEERRLCYVGFTRAKKILTLTGAARRMRNGQPEYNAPSRFINEIPRHLVNQKRGSSSRTSSVSRSGSYDNDDNIPFFDFNESNKRASYGTSGNRKQTSSSNSKDILNNLFANNPYIKKGFAASSSASSSNESYSEGDSVEHVKFGIGTVTETVDKGDYTEITVEFEDFGVRKVRSDFKGIKKA
ncbi:MAG: DNA helicase PcrA [Eubacterium sp.]|nr:DNA helicase PcrA [Eubacterium sp.]